MKTNWKEWYSTGKLAAAGVGMQCLAAVIYAMTSAAASGKPLPLMLLNAMPIFWILGLVLITFAFPYSKDLGVRRYYAFLLRIWIAVNPLLQLFLVGSLFYVVSEQYADETTWFDASEWLCWVLPYVVLLCTIIAATKVCWKNYKTNSWTWMEDFWPIWITSNCFLYFFAVLFYRFT